MARRAHHSPRRALTVGSACTAVVMVATIAVRRVGEGACIRRRGSPARAPLAFIEQGTDEDPLDGAACALRREGRRRCHLPPPHTVGARRRHRLRRYVLQNNQGKEKEIGIRVLDSQRECEPSNGI